MNAILNPPDLQWCRRAVGLLLIGLTSTLAWAQTNVSGKVIDDKGEALPGVSVIVEGTSKGANTNAEGMYVISVPSEKAVLVFSFVGYLNKKATVGKQSTIDVTLAPDPKTLEEVVVVGYGTQRKRDVTGAITSVNRELIEQRQPLNVYDAIQGQAAGVQVASESGRPGAASTIRIRGSATFEGGVNPLYIVDGVPVDNIDGINPNDIESVEILKDAASASIYGSRSANGVLIITTKKGAEGKAKFNLRYLQSVGQLSHKIPQANADERRLYDLKRSGAASVQADSLNPSFNADNDYQDQLTQIAKRYQVDFSVNGSSKTLAYYASLGYLSDDGIIINSYARNIRGRINIDYRPNNRVTYSNRIQFAYITENRISEGNTLNQAIQRPPNFRVYLPDGTLAPIIGGRRNPVAEALLATNQYDTYQANLYNYAEYKFSDYIKLSADINARFEYDHNSQFSPKLLSSAAPAQNTGSDRRDFDTYLIGQSYLNFNRTFGRDHNVTALLGVSAERWVDQYTNIAGQNYVTETVGTLNSAQVITLGSTRTDDTRHTMASAFARLGYSYKGRYLLNATVRRDGSSRFGANKRYGVFPSASVGWRLSDESFMSWAKPYNADIKLRASYGLTGNERIGNYDAVQRYVFGSAYYNGTSGVVPNTLFGNSELSWEQTTQFNAGLDVAMFNNRLTLVVDYYRKLTENLLYSAPLPAETGFSNVKVNIGSIRNQGLELTLGGYPVRNSRVQWNSSFNISFNQNFIDKLYNGVPFIPDGKWYVEQGGKLGNFYGWKALGVYAYDESNAYDASWNQLTPVFEGTRFTGYTENGQPYTGKVQRLYTNGNLLRGGDVIWQNTRRDSTIDDADRVILGNAQPLFYAGFYNTINYRNFSLALNFYTSWGGKIYNSARRDLNTYQTTNVTPEPYVIYNAWTRPGDVTNVPIARNNGMGNVREVNSNYIEDASFLRLRNIRLTYSLSQAVTKRLKLDALSVYIYGNNLLTWTNYSWFDPEITSTSPLQLGEDTGKYPRKREAGIGLNVNF